MILDDVTMTADGGERVGIAGRTGSGKSSLMLAMFRINPLLKVQHSQSALLARSYVSPNLTLTQPLGRYSDRRREHEKCAPVHAAPPPRYNPAGALHVHLDPAIQSRPLP